MKSTYLLTAVFLVLAGCNPTVKVEATDKPIEINLNVKIEHNIRLQLEKDPEDLSSADSDIVEG